MSDQKKSDQEEKSDQEKTQQHHEEMIRRLADILQDTGLGEIEYALADLKIRVKRSAPVAQQMMMAMPQMQQMAAPMLPQAGAAQGAGGDQAAAPSGATNWKTHPGAVKSPMVGTVYLSPEPGAPAFITEGASVKEGDTLLIVEAMKVMNNIKAPKSGVIRKILAENGRPIEYDDVMVVIE